MLVLCPDYHHCHCTVQYVIVYAMYVSSRAVKPPGLLNKFSLPHLILSYHKHKGFLMVWLIGVATVYFIVFKFWILAVKLLKFRQT